MTEKDGGPAFPNNRIFPTEGHGMSLRDWFAGQALIGLSTLLDGVTEMSIEHQVAPVTTWSKAAYQLADAMLAERDK